MRKKLRKPLGAAIILMVIVPITITFALGFWNKPKKSRAEELAYLRLVVAEELLDHAHIDAGTLDSLAIKDDEPNSYLGLRVFPGQPKVHGGIRAEVSVDLPHQPGDTVRYSWRVKFAEDFQTDPENRWWVVGQWHDQPDNSRGESWDHFPSRSPPVILGVGALNNQLSIGLSYGPTTTGAAPQWLSQPVALERGRWYQLTVIIQWSRGNDGRATMIIDDDQKAAIVAQGPNMNNDYRHYWKIGQYRHPDIRTDNTIYIDDMNARIVPGEKR